MSRSCSRESHAAVPIERRGSGADLRADRRGRRARRSSRYLAPGPTLEQFREFVIHRSAYQLKEADPHTFAIPRISGAPKAAMVEVQADEYGGGDSERMHSRLFAEHDGGPRPRLDLRRLRRPAPRGDPGHRQPDHAVLMRRRWRGALVGHLAGLRDHLPRAQPPLRKRPAPARLRRARQPSSTTSTSRPTPCTRTSPPTTSPADSRDRSPSSPATSCSGSRCLLHTEAPLRGQILDAAARTKLAGWRPRQQRR